MKESSEWIKRRLFFVQLTFFTIFSIIVIPTVYCQQHHEEKGGIEILGQRYSDNLKALYDKVIKLHNKPIKIVERIKKGDNSIDTHGNQIILKLGRGCSEDNIAHELMHAVLQAEHYPNFFSMTTLSLSQKLHAMCIADLDHLIINDRLIALGYNPHAGYLSKANGYENILKLSTPEDPGRHAIHHFCLLHELIKFHYYIADPNAERDILFKFPNIEKYWRLLSQKIDSLPMNPKPRDLWNIGAIYLGLGDEICKDLNAPFFITDLLGIGPLLVHPDDLAESAQSMFEITNEAINDQDVLVRFFTIDPHVMIHCLVIPLEHLPPKNIGSLSVSDYLKVLGVKYIVLE